MNLILLDEKDFLSETRVRLRDRRLQHLLSVHRATPGDRLRVGRIGGALGTGTVLALNKEQVDLEVALDQSPPAPLEITLLLALPRPKMLKRILQSISALGVKRIFLINSFRVEKSFWASPLLQPVRLCEQLLLGLEQACDTILPQVHLKPRFKPFVEDELPRITTGRAAYVAHPAAAAGCPSSPEGPTILAIGPEGGFIPYEVDKLQQAGFTPFGLGPRILRVETAVPVLLTRLSPN